MSRNLAKANSDNNKLRLIERKGVVHARKIGAQLKAGVVNAWRRKKEFGLGEALIKKLHPTFRDAMLAAHLKALQINSERALKHGLALSVFDDVLKTYKEFLGTDFDEIREYYDTKAFDILTGEGASVNRQMRQTLYGLVESGSHVKEGIEVLNNKLDSLGLGPQKDYRLEALFRTHTQMAFSAGKWAADQQPVVQDILWGYEYMTVGDDRVREDHIPLDGVRLEKDDPFWQTWFPPNGWNCRCQVVQIFKDDDEATKNPPPDDADLIQDKDFNFNPGEVVGPKTRFKTKPSKEYVKKKAPKKTTSSKTEKLKAELAALQKKNVELKKKLEEVEDRTKSLEERLKIANLVEGFVVAEDIHVKLKGVTKSDSNTMSICFEALKAVEDIHTRFPKVKELRAKAKVKANIVLENVEKVRKDDVTGHGIYNTYDGMIQVGLKSYPVKTTKRPVYGEWNTDPSISGCIRHEFGHHLHMSCMSKKSSSEWLKIWPDIPINRLSMYGKTAPKYGAEEGFAEAFRAYTHPNYLRGSLPKNVETFLDKELM